MQKTESLEEMLERGQELSSHDEPLAAWNAQQSTRAERFHVIFDGKVYFNTEWVDAVHCPGDINPENNPWKYERDATKKEMARLGNPTSTAHLRDHHHPLKS
jgi:hypothetical protein